MRALTCTGGGDVAPRNPATQITTRHIDTTIWVSKSKKKSERFLILSIQTKLQVHASERPTAFSHTYIAFADISETEFRIAIQLEVTNEEEDDSEARMFSDLTL